MCVYDLFFFMKFGYVLTLLDWWNWSRKCAEEGFLLMMVHVVFSLAIVSYFFFVCVRATCF